MAPTLTQKINRSLLAILLILTLFFAVVATAQTAILNADTESTPTHFEMESPDGYLEEEPVEIAGIYWPGMRP